MATLPKVQEIERRQIQPRTDVVSFQAGLKEAAEVELGNTVANVGGRVGRMAAYYNDQMNRKKAKEAVLQLREQSLQLEAETIKTKGAAAFDKGFLEERNNAYQTLSDSITDGMDEATKQYYDGEMKTHRLSYQKHALTHSMAEEQKMGKLLFDKEIVVDAQEAAANYDDVKRVTEIISDNEESTRDYFATQGITDKKIVEGMVLSRKSAIHKSIVESMIEDGNVKLAKAHMEMFKDEIAEDDVQAVSGKLKAESDYQVGVELSDAAMNSFYKGVDQQQILQEMEDASESKAEFDSAYSIYTKKLAAAKQEYTELAAEVVNDYSKGQGKGLNDARLATLDEIAPVAAHSVRTQIHQEDARRKAKAQGTPHAKPTTAQRAAFARVVQNAVDNNREISVDNWLAMGPTIGNALVEKGMEWSTSRKAAQAKADATGAAKYKLPADKIKFGLGEDTTSDQRRVMTGNMAVEADKFVALYGRPPTPDEENQIITRQIFIQEDTSFFGDDSEELVYGETNLDEDDRSYPMGLKELLPENNTFDQNYEIWKKIEPIVNLNPGVTLYDALQRYQLDEEKSKREALDASLKRVRANK